MFSHQKISMACSSKQTFLEGTTFYPSSEEFCDFNKYIQKIRKNSLNIGIIKIIPPKEWTRPVFNLAKRKFKDFDVQKVQAASNKNSIYFQNIVCFYLF
jgi:hypothetical protein